MADDALTLQQLEAFKQELLEELDKRLSLRQPAQRWLKSYQLKKLLSISHGKLQRLRASGALPYHRIGSVILYDYYDIEKMLSAHKQNVPTAAPERKEKSK